ncbi:hypothetical protein [Planctomycetes bacterium TBK1r]|uniref:Uncharacterized protein n=1 Tax=Stieleria magnilauensis TaxID=2527963 RepID=A0ABX5XI58_9BACT|nr:hypothetical protein TBK1r_05860 [Planctomycetes bacterium TBK1r]
MTSTLIKSNPPVVAPGGSLAGDSAAIASEPLTQRSLARLPVTEPEPRFVLVTSKTIEERQTKPGIGMQHKQASGRLNVFHVQRGRVRLIDWDGQLYPIDTLEFLETLGDELSAETEALLCMRQQL